MANETVNIIIKAFDQTQKALRSIQAAFGKLSKVFFNFKTALVAAVGAGGLGLLISNSLKATDALAKTASKIGTTTEALSALQYAGQLTGVEVNTMNMALQRFARRASEAAVGTGEAKGALRELRLDARELVKLPLDQQMLELADAFEDAKRRGLNPLRLGFKLFDSEGAQLVTTLAAGRDGLAEMFGEARRLGVVMSSNAAKGVEDANGALTRLQSLFGGVTKQVVAALAPVITALADTMTTEVASAFDPENNGIQEFAKVLAIEVVNGIIAAVRGLEQLTNGLIKTANEIIRTKDMLTSLFGGDQSAEQLQNAIDKIDERLANLRKRYQGDSPLAQFGKADIANLELQRQKLVELKEAAEKSGRIRLIDDVSFQALIDKLETAIPKIKGVTDGVNDLADSTNEKIPTAFETFMANLQRTRELAGELQPQLEKLADKAITGLGQSFTDAITGAKNFSDAIKSMAKSVIDSLIRILVQKYLVDAAFGAITRAFAPKPLVGPTGIEFGPAADHVGRARGGPVAGGRPYLVGERGPELMVPAGNGTVVPNNALGGGGVTVVQNINVTTGVQQTVRAEIANLLPQISNAAKSAVADARMRGGGFSKAMVGA
jgi:uncharacterized protein YukE